jgi:hypothetical protein
MDKKVDLKQFNPGQLFAIDGVGAVISATLLAIIAIHLQPYFGVPLETLYWLIAIPMLFVLYDLYCFFFIQQKRMAQYLQYIAVANFGYCILSFSLLIYHLGEATWIAWLYFIGELIIIIILATAEWKVARKHLKKQKQVVIGEDV